MRIGFVGVGGVAQTHLKNLSQMDGVQIAAVCDIVPERVQQVADVYGAKGYGDYKEMLAGESLDACYVCVIPVAHAEIELDLAKAKIPFYGEKPVHLDLDVCARVIEAVEANSVINSVGYHWRYTDPIREAQAWVAQHRVSIVEGWWYGGFVSGPWWRQMKLSGGQIVEQSTHVVDSMRFVAGEVHTVFGAGSFGAMEEIENYDIHDTSIVTMMFDSGAIGQLTTGCIAEKHGGGKVGITAKGRDWAAEIGTNKAVLKDAEGSREVADEVSWGDQLGLGDQAFVQAVRSNSMEGVTSPYVSGAQTLAITLAANESIASGAPVKVRRFV